MKENPSKPVIPSEVVYVLAITLLPLAVSILASVDFGLSMIVSPAYLVSLKLGCITFGQAEYLLQAIVFLLLCLVLRGFRPIYLMSFVTCLIYGWILDLWRTLPCFNPQVTVPGSMGLGVRLLLFALGLFLTSFSISLFFKTYAYPQVYDFFVKAVSRKYGIRLSLFKTRFDLTLLAISLVLSLCFFGKIVGVGWGTLVLAFCNGTFIGLFTRMLDHSFIILPAFPRFARHFALSQEHK